MSYNFGTRSRGNLDTCHPDLIKIAEHTLRCSQVDFSITEGHRSIERQKMLFDKGRSKIDGIKRKGKHNYDPSLALDFAAYVPGKPKLVYDKNHLMYIVGVFTACAEMLFMEGIISHKLRSGANWDKDGELLYDQSFWDMPHVELVKP